MSENDQDGEADLTEEFDYVPPDVTDLPNFAGKSSHGSANRQASHFLLGNTRIIWPWHMEKPRSDLRPYGNRSSLWPVTRRKGSKIGFF